MGKLPAQARFFSPLPRGFLAKTSCAHYYHSTVVSRKYATNLPAQVNLLERYRGLVALGQLQADEEQIRVIAQLRRLSRDLDEYAPPAVLARHLNQTHTPPTQDATPWWTVDGPVLDMQSYPRGLIRVKTHAEEIADLDTPKGLLITGPPGSGKSFLIDLWLATLPTPYKARKNYGELVLEIYRAVWEETRRRMVAMHAAPASSAPQASSRPWNKVVREQWRELLKAGSLPIRWARMSNMSFSLSQTPQDPNIAYVVAQRLILRHWLLVFDEIQLLDVSSATLIADVLSWFWRMGGVIVGSSNKVPDDLYKNGVQRERLEPFVEALKARCPVVFMRSERDWRAVRSTSGERSRYTFAQHREFDNTVEGLVRGARTRDSEEAPSVELSVFGRTIHVPWSANGYCRFTFAELCDQSLGPADYITLASTYRTFIITSVPILTLSAKNQARRFISLIDALYEARCRIICLAEGPPEALFFPDAPARFEGEPERSADDVDVMMAEAVAETQDVYRPNVSSYDAPNMEQEPRAPAKALALDTLSIFSGKDEQFAYKRALSRLLEMTSESYAREERWASLSPDSRKWEMPASPTHTRAVPPAPRAAAASSRTDMSSPHDAASDFAEEASQHCATPADRPPAPWFSTDHVWGVREDWGQRARAWGRGAAAYGVGSASRASVDAEAAGRRHQG